MSHPQTAEAVEKARKGDWTLLQNIFGWNYIAELRRAGDDEDVLRYLAQA